MSLTDTSPDLPAGPRIVWAICTIARSGSSWLSQLVASTKLLGIPEEYLLNWPHCCPRYGLSLSTPLEEYLACLLRRRSTPNGVFAIKGSYDELQPFLKLFPSAPCVWLSRENKHEQAISWHRAHDGGRWIRTTGASPPPSFRFSASRALEFYDEILRRESLWTDFFSSRDIKPLPLTYEQLCRDPLTAVRSIASHIGIDPAPISHITSPLQIVRDHHTPHLLHLFSQALQTRSLQPPTPNI